MLNYTDLIGRLAIPITVLAAGPIIAAGKWLKRRWGTGPARDWPTIAASIDVVSVVEQIREGRYGSANTTGFSAELTYFYRNPELQMGEYKRPFPLEAAARQWAESLKNKQVLVHVNPKDPADSVLLNTDLDGISTSVPFSLEDALRLEKLPRLKQGYLLLSGISEIVSLAGLSITAAALWIHSTRGTLKWVTMTLIVMLGFNFITAWIVAYRADDARGYQAILHRYTLFCPAWMRWGVHITGALLFGAWVISDLNELLPLVAQRALAAFAPYLPYLFGFWGFLSTGATHAAILRSQELTRKATGSETLCVAENASE